MKIFRSGFSFVEIIIALFFAFELFMAMLGQSRENAGATGAIINNLRNLKVAALVFYAQNPDVKPNIDDVIKTAGGGKYDGYNFLEDGGKSFVVFGKGNAKDIFIPETVKKKLTSRAGSVGLMGSSDNETAPTEEYSAHEAVSLRVR